ncbi:MAG TPA: DUF805 domain-containing protein, partial [Sinorhizobium sp.]|nr:DUF805 domain-containing protein [Sinorhizobium sp.]
MGSVSIWHWLVVLIVFVLPIIFILKAPPAGPNRFGEIPPSMNFGEAIASFFKNYVNFANRASRSEFWYAMLFAFGIPVILKIVDPTEILRGIFGLAVLLPTLAVGARRLHDINRSGWSQLLSWLFPIGTIAVIVWWCQG